MRASPQPNEELRRANDRTGDELREEGDEEREVEQ